MIFMLAIRETVYPDFAGGREEFRRRRKGGGQGVEFPAVAYNQKFHL